MATLPYGAWEQVTTEVTNLTLSLQWGQPTYACRLYKFTTSGVIMGLLAIFGVIGNGIAVAGLWSDRNHSATSFLLIVLAIVDDLVLLSRFLLVTVDEFCDFTGSCSPLLLQLYNGQFLVYAYPTMTLCLFCSVYIILQVTVHRYIVVCWPHKSATLGSVKAAKLQAVATILFCFLFSLPRYIMNIITYRKDGTTVSLAMGAKDTFALVYLLIAVSIFLYVFPMAILTMLTYKLYCAVKEARKRREQMTSKARDREDITVTLIVVVVVFIICQIADPARRLVAAFTPPDRLGCGYPYFYVSQVTAITVSLNSAINSVLYCICSPRFRRKVRGVFIRTHRVGSFMESNVGLQINIPG